jgi:hypothetical protein
MNFSLLINKEEKMPAQEVNEITEKMIGCAYTVSNTLGIGFVVKVYENALVFCTRKTGLLVEQQYPIKVTLTLIQPVHQPIVYI